MPLNFASASASTSAAPRWDLNAADDPADWEDEFSYLKPLDAALRCELCFDVFRAPVSLRCGHTFCSTCVRNAINQGGAGGQECPKCRAKAQDSHLTPQIALETAAEAWRDARARLYDLQTARKAAAEGAKSEATSPRGLKRKASEEPNTSTSSSRTALSPPNSSLRQTRSSSRRQETNAVGPSSKPEYVVVSDDDDGDVSYVPSNHASPSKRGSPSKKSPAKAPPEADASERVQCPLCSHTFTLAALNRHLDRGVPCSPDDPPPIAAESGLATPRSTMSTGWFTAKAQGNGASIPKGAKLVRPPYVSLREKQIRELLMEHRLSIAGSKERRIERHRHWVNIYNANLDASERNRRTVAQLRREMEEWDKGQDDAERQKARGGAISEKRAKDWAGHHNAQFSELTAAARDSHRRNREAHRPSNQVDSGNGRQLDAPVPTLAPGADSSAETSV
ncbi:hypothetical protein IE81DRAFT_320226 [Ceraceosorus guamensis]|uniref:Postreplication repair E3 ubiquitin-protein ligase RAD18 n=1 Tax=Ceraceosorus guamensis TaxID=1522189 RepID=A0A316WC29_9BASI|nr:hypothetical protein IE81DRAFT_320226 [Ceraceosorus guamensis]PWN45463.1 hypothetical protein IE81DRAFT_320226 [Ceraceosorus guamensis]